MILLFSNDKSPVLYLYLQLCPALHDSPIDFRCPRATQAETRQTTGNVAGAARQPDAGQLLHIHLHSNQSMQGATQTQPGSAEGTQALPC